MSSLVYHTRLRAATEHKDASGDSGNGLGKARRAQIPKPSCGKDHVDAPAEEGAEVNTARLPPDPAPDKGGTTSTATNAHTLESPDATSQITHPEPTSPGTGGTYLRRPVPPTPSPGVGEQGPSPSSPPLSDTVMSGKGGKKRAEVPSHQESHEGVEQSLSTSCVLAGPAPTDASTECANNFSSGLPTPADEPLKKKDLSPQKVTLVGTSPKRSLGS